MDSNYKTMVIQDWLDYLISSDDLSLYLKHKYKAPKVQNVN